MVHWRRPCWPAPAWFTANCPLWRPSPSPKRGIEAFRTEFEQTLRRHGAGADGVLVLCDMECGTPYNVACRFAFDPEWPQPLAVVTGVNFPMLLMSAELLDAVDVHEAARQLLVQALESMVIAAPAAAHQQDDNF